MNNFTKKNLPSNDGPGAERTGTPWVAGLICNMALIMVIIFGAFFARVYLNDKTEQLAAEKSRISKQIEDHKKEIKTLELRLAELKSWENISSKIRQYNLALRAVNPSQVRYMRRFDGPVNPASLNSDDTRIADTSAAGGIL